MGPLSILPRLPRIIARVLSHRRCGRRRRARRRRHHRRPEFTHPIAKRIRKRAPQIPIIDYVSPERVGVAAGARAQDAPPTSITCWRCCRSSRRRTQRLGGPPCTYVGHPLIERLDWMHGSIPSRWPSVCGSIPDAPVLVVLPGSRTSEVGRLMEPFGEALRAARTSAGIRAAGHHSRRAARARRSIEAAHAVVAGASRTSSKARRTSSAPSSSRTPRSPLPAR